mgnify:CR=1 FL=1
MSNPVPESVVNQMEFPPVEDFNNYETFDEAMGLMHDLQRRAYREAVKEQVESGRTPVLVCPPPLSTLVKRDKRWMKGKRLRTTAQPQGGTLLTPGPQTEAEYLQTSGMARLTDWLTQAYPDAGWIWVSPEQSFVWELGRVRTLRTHAWSPPMNACMAARVG